MATRRKIHILAIAIASSDKLLMDILWNIQSENESENSDNDEQIQVELRRRINIRGQQKKPHRIGDYVKETIPRLTNNQFREHFRMLPQIYELFEQRLADTLLNQNNNGRPTIPVRKQLLAALWLLAIPDSYRSVGERFDMNKSSLNVSFMRVVEALNDIAGNMIEWPRGEKAIRVKEKFKQISGLPNVHGAIDESYIEIKTPKNNAQYYINRKNHFAITLQALSDADLYFTECFTGYASSVNDIRIFRNFDLWMEVQNNYHYYFPTEEYIIGDKVYPVLTWCISSYRNFGNLTEVQKNLNYIHAKTRQVIERAFSLLKGRFRRLKFLNMNRDDMIPHVIIASCVLHNICLTGTIDNIEDFILEGQESREVLPEACLAVNEPVINENAGVIKREYLAMLVS